MTSEQERLARLRRTLHSLATRVPKIILTRVDWRFPVLKYKSSVILNESGTEVAQCIEDVNSEELLGEQSAELSELHSEENFYSCETCKKSFSRSNNPSGHTSVSSRETMPCCEKCIKLSTQKRSAMRRFRGRERPFSCNACQETFPGRYALDSHIRIRNGKRLFSCKVCKKSFGYRSTLNTHLRVHTGERPFSCEICKKRFTLLKHLNRHLRVHSGERPFSCEVCKKRFTQRSHLNTHLSVHSGERPFLCKLCEKRFAQHSHLNAHMRVHSAEQTFSTNCRTVLSDRHQAVHHGR